MSAATLPGSKSRSPEALHETVSPMPGGTFLVTLKNGQKLPVSRQRSKVLRERLLRF